MEKAHNVLDDLWRHEPPYPKDRIRHIMDIIGNTFYKLFTTLHKRYQIKYAFTYCKLVLVIVKVFLNLMINFSCWYWKIHHYSLEEIWRMELGLQRNGRPFPSTYLTGRKVVEHVQAVDWNILAKLWNESLERRHIPT